MKALTIIGRRWFRRSAGNTYSSAQVYIDGVLVMSLGPTGGYGDYYVQMAVEALDGKGLLPGIEHYAHGGTEALWRYCERNNIAYVAIVSDVAREKDL